MCLNDFLKLPTTNRLEPKFEAQSRLDANFRREKLGAREQQVEEPLFAAKSILFEFEVDEVAESKALLPKDIIKLVKKHGSFRAVSDLIGMSESFVRQNAIKCRSTKKS